MVVPNVRNGPIKWNKAGTFAPNLPQIAQRFLLYRAVGNAPAWWPIMDRSNFLLFDSTPQAVKFSAQPAGRVSYPISIDGTRPDQLEWPVFGEQLRIYAASIRPSRDVAAAKYRRGRMAGNLSGTGPSPMLAAGRVVGHCRRSEFGKQSLVQIRRTGKAAIRSTLKFSAHVVNANGKLQQGRDTQETGVSGSSRVYTCLSPHPDGKKTSAPRPISGLTSATCEICSDVLVPMNWRL